MIIAVAGPYSADTSEQRKKNLDALNEAAARLLEAGHIPIVGVNAALPVVKKSNVTDEYNAIMKISLVLIDKCDAILMIGDSPGAQCEKDLIESKGLPVYYKLSEIPGIDGAVHN